MPGQTRRESDPKQGEQLSLGGLREEAQSETHERGSNPNPGGRETNNSSEGERKDFDDGANALWSLYNKEAQTHDEAFLKGMLADMSGIPTFAGLLAVVITSFLVDSLKNLKPDPAQQSVYYHQQSVAMLAQISQQVTSIPPQVTVPSIPPPPYPAFHPSKTDVAVNSLWLVGLVFSLVAALSATHVQECVRSYMRDFQQCDHPLKRARFRQTFFDNIGNVQSEAAKTTGTIRMSLVLLFLGLFISIFDVNATIRAITFILPISLFTSITSFFPRNNFLTFLTSMKVRVVMPVMQETDERKDRDVRATRWLVNRTAANAEMEPLLLTIPGSFNTEWGKDVWREVSTQAHTSEPPTGHPPAGCQVSPSPSPPEGVAADKISQSVKYLFDPCNHHSYFENDGARHRRMRLCVEATSSLVCLIDYRLDRFGEIGKVVSEIGHIENISQSLTTSSDTSFVIRWTCLSLVDIQRTLGRNRLKAPAAHAVNELACFQPEHGQPDETGQEGAQKIDERLKAAWERVEDLRRAFEPWTPKRTQKQVQQILRTHEQLISDLERLKSEADGMADVDQQISVYQDAMDDATHRLTWQLPGVSFGELHLSHLISSAFDTVTGDTPATVQLIYPGQQLRTLARFGSEFRDVLDGWSVGGLENLKAVDKIPVSLRWPNGLMMRQLWRLQDVRDGGSLGFSAELFFLSLRRLLSISSLDESNSLFYTGTFKTITSRWEESKQSLGTHGVLLTIICDLIIPGRGTFSDFSCPESITTMLLDVIGKMLQGYTGPDEHIRDAVREIESANPDEDIPHGVQEIEDDNPIRMDRRELQRRALMAFPQFRSNP
ncbi:hypothetical protein EDB85DRAFT_2204753 [Lactarius pseudohatsudake]|nr:hypothetical protein EDB85DRAFT_2204753 [Lactarius pseudohatsudake]